MTFLIIRRVTEVAKVEAATKEEAEGLLRQGDLKWEYMYPPKETIVEEEDC